MPAALVAAWWAVRILPAGEHNALDALLYFLPSYATIAAHFRAGEIPLWNPYQLCGIPWIGTLQSAVFYPFRVLYAVLPLHQAFALTGVLHLAIAALATAAFVRRLGLAWSAAFLAAVVFTMRGNMRGMLHTPNALEAMAWLPVGAFAIVDLARTPGRRSIALLAAATAMSFLAGYPQVTVYVVYAWGTLFLALLVQARPAPGPLATRVAGFAGALALGGIVAAVQLLPALELMTSGTRAGALTDPQMFSLGPILTPGLLFFRGQAITGTPFAFGLVALALVPAAVLAPGRRALGCWAVGVAALTLAWSLGRGTPLFELYLALPPLALFREPSRVLVVADFTVAIAAALGLAAVSGRVQHAPSRPRLRLAAIATSVVTLALVVVLARRGWAPPTDDLVVLAVATFGLLSAFAWTGPGRRGIVATGAALLAIVEIARQPAGQFRLPSADDVAAFDRVGPDLRHVASLAGHDRVWRALTGVRIDQAQKLSTWYRLRTIGDYEPVNLHRQAQYFTYLRDGSTIPKRWPWLFTGDVHALDAPPDGPPPATRRRLLDLAAVRWVVLGRGALLAPATQAFVRGAGLRLRREPLTHVDVFENAAALPRAFVTYRVQAAPSDPDTLLAAVSAPSFDPLAESYVEGPPPFRAAADAPPRGAPVVFVQDGETEVELEATLTHPGLVVLADSFYPGWHATVDGEPAPILATNHLFRGVPAPAGTHRIRFVYAPASVRLGGIASLAGLAAVVWLAIGRRHRLSPQ